MPHVPRPPGHWVRHLLTLAGVCVAALAATPHRATAQCSNTSVVLSPCNGTVTLAGNTSNQKYVFTFTNLLAVQQQVDVSVSCTGYVTDCTSSATFVHMAAHGSGNVTVTYSTATGTTGTFTLGSNVSSTITVSAPTHVAPIVTLPYYNDDNVQPSLCAANCFDKVLTYATPAYYTMDMPRIVTLMYRSNTANPMVTVQVDGLDESPTPPTQMSLKIQRTDTTGSPLVTFTNHSTELFFNYSNSLNPRNRLAGQFAPQGRDTLTGAYNYTAIVTSYFHDGTVLSSSIPLRVLIENERSSVFGVGWTVAGQQTIYPQSNGDVVITDGMGAISYFKLQVAGCTQGCAYTSPTGDFTVLTTKAQDQFGRHYDRRYPDGTTYEFLGGGALAGIFDKSGSQTVFWYDSKGRDSLISDPLGTSFSYGMHFVYGDTPQESGGWKIGAIRQIYDPYGRYTWFGVGATTGDMNQIEDPDGGQYGGIILAVNATYNSLHQMTGNFDRHQAASTFYYDFAGKLAADSGPAVLADGATQSIATKYTSTESQFLLNPSSGAGTSTNPGPSELGGEWPAYVTDPEGHQATVTIDRWGQPLQITDPVGGVTTFWRGGSYGVEGGSIPPFIVIYPWGEADTMSYNANGLLTRFAQPGHGATYYGYGNNFAIADTVTGPNVSQVLTVDGSGNVTAAKFGKYATKYYVDSRGRDTMIVDPLGHTTKYHYDPIFGNRDSTLAIGNRFTKKTFDAYGRQYSYTANALPTTYAWYDPLNRLTKTYAGAQVDTTRYSYDSLYLVSVQDAKGQVYQSPVNALGWKTQSIDPTGKAESYGYDKNGNVTSYTNRRSQTVNKTYDALNRVKSKSGTGVMTANFSYSANQRITVGSNAVSIDTIYMDSTGWRNEVSTTFPLASGSPSFRVRHFQTNGLFDSTDVQTTTGIAFGGWSYHYEAPGQPTGVSMPQSARLTYGYNGEGFIDSIYYNTSESIMEWHGRLANHRMFDVRYVDTPLYGADTALDNAFARNYYYDSGDRLRQVTQAVPAVTDAYVYDSLARLAADTNYGAVSCSAVDTTFGWACSSAASLAPFQPRYDSVGNLTTNNGGVATYGNANRIQQNNTTGTFLNATYSTDADGNVTRRVYTETGEAMGYAWSPDGLLVSDTVEGNGAVMQYDYNAFGRLVRRTTSGTVDRYFLWDNDNLLAELNGAANNRIAEYVYSLTDNPVAFITGATAISAVRYFVQDQVGNVIGSWGGGTTQTIGYTQFGRFNELGGPGDTTRLRWKGMIWEGDSTQLYYARNRWYDPVTGRFMSEDPAGLAGGINEYVFAGDDYINGSDPLGLDPDEYGCNHNSNLDPGSTTQAHDYITCPGDDPGVLDDPYPESTEDPVGVLASIGKVAANPCLHAIADATLSGLTDAAFILGPEAEVLKVAAEGKTLAQVGGRAALDALTLNVDLATAKQGGIAYKTAQTLLSRFVFTTGLSYHTGYLDDPTAFAGSLVDLIPVIGTVKKIGEAVEACSGGD